MKITLKLYATLTDLLPAGAFQNAIEIELPEGTSLNTVIDKFRVPRELAHLVLINGCFHCQADWDSLALTEGDTLAIWPPVAGG